MAAGHGGQILAATTAALVGGVGLVDLGEHRLRDLSGVEHLFQARGDGLRAQFPALRTIDAVPGNLAVQATSFVGRDVEVKELTTGPSPPARDSDGCRWGRQDPLGRSGRGRVGDRVPRRGVARRVGPVGHHDLDRCLTRGARLDRDQLIIYILDQQG